MGSAAPLSHVRVLDFSTVGPAARAARTLADYGADVVKVGAPPRQEGVQIRPVFHAYAAHRGMRRVAIDLKAAAGREAFLRLAADADVVIESFRPGVVDRLGIGYDAVCEHNPGIVYCSTSGYGQDGPHAAWAGHDVNYLAVGGFLHCTGRRADGGPPLPGATIADAAAGGMHAVIAIMAALVARDRSGDGAHLDVGVADGVLSLLALSVDAYLATGEEPGPGADLLTGRYACYDTYRCADDGWIAVGAIEPRFWANVCRATGCERWIEHQTDDAVQDAVRADLAAAFATRPRDAWVGELGPGDGCVAPVLSIPELVADPQYAARGAFVDADHPTRGRFRQVAPMLAGMPRPTGPVSVPADDASDTAALLAAAGYAAGDIARLTDEGIVA